MQPSGNCTSWTGIAGVFPSISAGIGSYLHISSGGSKLQTTNPCSQQCAVARSSRPRPTLATSCGWSKPDRSPCSQQCAVGPQSVSAFCSTHICCRGSGSPHGCNERLTAPRPTGAFDQSVQLQGGAYFFIPLGKLGGVFGIAGEMRRVTFPVATRAQGFVVDSLRQALLAWMTVSSGNVTNHRFSATPRR